MSTILSFSPGSLANEDAAIIAIECCTKNIKCWMYSNKFMVNHGETEVIIFGTRQQLSKAKIDHIGVSDCEIKPTTSVRNPGTFALMYNLPWRLILPRSAA